MAIRPNAIDWNMVFSNMDFLSNPTLYCVEIIVFVVFVFSSVIARKADKKDTNKVSTISLLICYTYISKFTSAHSKSPHLTTLP